ncbi:MAG: HDOD domain-containing protein [Methylococcales bacterium]
MLITPEVLLKFSSFRQLSEEQQRGLLRNDDVKMLRSHPGEKIIARGSNDNFSFFLVSGALKLIARDGQTALIKADSDSAKQPITQLKPRQYDVVADSTITYLKINNQVLDNLGSDTGKAAPGIKVENEAGNADVYFQLYHDIKSDHVVLPSLSDVALKINKAIEVTEKINAQQLGGVILTDPAIAAKLIKLALVTKSGETLADLEDIEQVINRLGFIKTVEVVRVLSVKDVFRPVNELHHQFIKEVWRETLYISFIAAALAEGFAHLHPKKAQLIGLIHNIGAILILDCLGKEPSVVSNARQMQAIMNELGNNISSMLLEKWGFSEQFIRAAKGSQQWQRTNEGKPLDYCDLIIIAKLLSTVATPRFENTPVLTELAVFRKLNWPGNGIAQGLQVLNRARKNMDNLIRVFGKL